MSQKVEQTLQKTANALAQLNSSGVGPSKSFQLLVRAVGEAKTKHEEDRIMRKESATLKERMGARDTTPRQMREYLIRLLYCEMLGVECAWGYIHAVKFTQSTGIVDKRIGYLISSLVLHPDNELNMLLINSIQRDLRSSNMMEVSMALIIICRLIGEEMIPALLPLVREKLLHPKELVRKKALMAIHHFYLCSPSSVSHLIDDMRRALSDPDPGVMESALMLLHDIIRDNPSGSKDLCSAFINIMSQVVSRRLPSEFDYHGVPAPWLQIKLLRILAFLGADDSKASEEMYDIIEKTLGSAECNSNIGQAITYECIRTITAIYPRPSVIHKGAKAIERFLTGDNNNWKYLGINALGALVQVEPKYAVDYQMIVIECLDDPDETLKRKTLDLLYKMTNPSNVAVITDRLITYLRTAYDEFIKSDLVSKITQLAERFSPDNQWFIDTMNSVFELGGDLVRREVAHNLMRLIAEGTDDEEIDQELQKNAVSSYLVLLDKPHLPDVLIKIMCWVIGEYAYHADTSDSELILEKVTGLLNREYEDPQAKSWIINAITRLVAQIGYLPDYTHSLIALYLTSEDTDIQQRCSELLELSNNFELMQEVLPLDSACEDLEVDASLSFLDSIVSEALVQGAAPYRPKHLRKIDRSETTPTTKDHSIKFEPYAAPVKPSLIQHTSLGGSGNVSPGIKKGHVAISTEATPTPSSVIGDGSDVMMTSSASSSPDVNLGIRVKGDRKWGKGGYKKAIGSGQESSTPPPSSPAVAHKTTVVDQIVEPDHTLDHTLDYSQESTNEPSIKVNTVEAQPVMSSADRHKKDLASALFTGLSGPSRPVKTRPKGGDGVGVVRDRRETPRQPKGSDIGNLLDLQDIDFSTSTSAEPTEPHPQEPHPQESHPSSSNAPLANSLFDDLIVSTSEATPTETAPPTSYKTPPTANNTSNDLIGLFDSPISSESSQPLLMATPTSKTEDTGKMLAIMDAPITASAELPQQYISLATVAGWDRKEVVNDSQMRVSVSKLVHNDMLVMVLLVTNQKQAPCSDITLSITGPSNLKITGCDGDLSWRGNIAGFGNHSHILHIVPSSPAINMVINGEVIYRDNRNTSQRLFFDVSISVTDLLRPLLLKTDEFGKKWSSLSCEKKLKLSCSTVKSPSDFMNIIKSSFNFHGIEIIGKEAITAATFLPNTPCFIHGKTTPTTLELWIKSPSSLLTDSLAKQAQTIFK